MANHVEDLTKKIVDCLGDKNTKKVVLFGEAGVGKTWMARKVSNLALQQGSSYGTIWMFPVEKFDKKILLENIASQLSVLSSTEEWDDDDDTEEANDAEMRPENLEQKILEKLKELKSAKHGNQGARSEKQQGSTVPSQANAAQSEQNPTGENGNYLLVVLDDISNKYDELVHQLDTIISPKGENTFKILITIKENFADDNERTDSIQVNRTKTFKVELLSTEESLTLLKERVNSDVSANPKFRDLSEAIAKNCFGLPVAIIMVAEAFNHIDGRHKDMLLNSAIEDAANCSANDRTPLLRFIYDMLPGGTIQSCYWLSRQLFGPHSSVGGNELNRSRSAIHYNELITYWLLEGCFDHHDIISKAYEDGHHVLMELKDRGMLKGQNNYVSMETELWQSLRDNRKNGSTETMKLGLANVLDDDAWDAFKGITLGDGMIKTIYRRKQKREISTLVIDGTHLSREIPGAFFQSMTKLKILAILNPKFTSLAEILPNLKDLQVLVLRGCRFLRNADAIKELTKLAVLEVSGASSLVAFNNELFTETKDLKSVHLSGTEFTTIPATLSQLDKLRLLILRDCLKIKELPSLKNLINLEILDISGCASIEKLPDGNFSTLKKLHILNVSRTKMKNFPIMREINGLTHILATGCPNLTMLRGLKSMAKLQVIDISGATMIKDINGAHLEDISRLEILDLSGSGITSLPRRVCNISYLHLRSCKQLKALPLTGAFRDLELLDLSGSVEFCEITDKSFEHLKTLRRLDLSYTKVNDLPPLSPLVELRHLLLRNCEELTALQNLSAPTKLEVLDLSGCSKLRISQDESFKHMSRLTKLDLSETIIESLPADSFPANLCHLLLRKCTIIEEFPSVESLSKLERLDLSGSTSLGNIGADFLKNSSSLQILNLSEVPVKALDPLSRLTKLRELSLKGCPCVASGLESLKELEVLDLSGTKVNSLPSLDSYTNLIELRLRNCSNLTVLTSLQSLTKLEVLDLTGTKIKDFPYEALELTCLRELHLQDMSELRDIDWMKVKYLPEEFNLNFCGTLIPSPEHTMIGSPSILVRGTKFFSFLKQYPNLWEMCFKKFHFSVMLSKEHGKVGITYFPSDMSLIKFVNSHGRFPYPIQHEKLLEIQGSCAFSDENSFPGELEDALGNAEHISVIDNDKVAGLSDLGEDKLKLMTSCWLERCPMVRTLLSKEEDSRLGEKLNSLYLSSLPSLEKVCISDESLQSGIFLNLRNLYIDCCPQLRNMFPLSKLPQNLETLIVKFCDKLEALFEDDVSTECSMPKLQLLELFELPKLKTIGAATPALTKLRVRECRALEKLEETLAVADKLETLTISGVTNLKNVYSGNTNPESFRNLKNLMVESCPELLNVFSSAQLPENLETLEVKHCKQLQTIYEGGAPAVSRLSSVYLWKLPQLRAVEWPQGVTSIKDYSKM